MTWTDPSALGPDMVAPCGMNCALCLAYQRTKRHCPGCWGEDANKSESCRSCIIRNCETIQMNRSHFCYDCEKMPCQRLKRLDKRYRTKYGMSMIANLTEIRDRGMEVFLSDQAKRYMCPSCGGLRCVHRPHCLNCGEEWDQDHGN